MYYRRKIGAKLSKNIRKSSRKKAIKKIAQHKTKVIIVLHVSKVVRYLQQPAHLCFIEEIEYGVDEDVSSCRSGRAESDPLPMIILRIQNEVDSHYRSADSHHAQYRIH